MSLNDFFYRIHNPIKFNYTIGYNSLLSALSVKDLGIIFSQDLNIRNHIEYIVGESSKWLGFVKRHSSDFNFQ